MTCSTRQLTFWNRSLLYNLFKSIVHQLALNQKPQVTFPGWLPLQATALTVSNCMTILGTAKSAKKLSQYAARSKSSAPSEMAEEQPPCLPLWVPGLWYVASWPQTSFPPQSLYTYAFCEVTLGVWLSARALPLGQVFLCRAQWCFTPFFSPGRAFDFDGASVVGA